MKFVCYVSHNNISKVFSVPWSEGTYENLLNAALQEFEIPPNEAYQKKFCDINGILYTRESFEQTIHRSINDGYIPHIRLSISDEFYQDHITSSTSHSESREYDRQDVQVIDLRNKASNLFTSLSKIEDNLNEAEVKLQRYKAKIETNQGGPQLNEPTHSLNEPEVDIDEVRCALRNREIKLDVQERLLLEFESRLKKKKDALNRREIELNKMRRRFIRRNDILKNREANVACRTAEVNMQNYTLNKLENILHRLSDELNIKREQLDQHEFLLNQKEAMLDEDRNKIKKYKRSIKSKGRKRKMEVDTDLDENEEEAKSIESASTSNHNHSRGLSKSFLMKLETMLNNRNPKISLLGISKRQKLIKLNGSNAQLIRKQTMSNDFNEGNSSTDQESTFDNSKTDEETETLTRNEEAANIVESSSTIQAITF